VVKIVKLIIKLPHRKCVALVEKITLSSRNHKKPCQIICDYIDVPTYSIYVGDIAAGEGNPAPGITKTLDTPIAGHRNLIVHHNADGARARSNLNQIQISLFFFPQICVPRRSTPVTGTLIRAGQWSSRPGEFVVFFRDNNVVAHCDQITRPLVDDFISSRV